MTGTKVTAMQLLSEQNSIPFKGRWHYWDLLQYFISLSSRQWVITRHIKKQENVANRQEKNHSIENNFKITQMLKLADKNFKIAITNMFKNLKENVS